MARANPSLGLWRAAKRRSFTPPNLLDFYADEPLRYDWSWRTWWPFIWVLCLAHGLLTSFLPAIAQDEQGNSIDVEALNRQAQFSSEAITQAYDLVWRDNMESWMRIVLTTLAFIAVIALGWLALHLAKQANSTGHFPWEKIVVPALLVVFLTSTNTTVKAAESVKDLINKANEDILVITGAKSTINEAQALSSYPTIISSQLKQCDGMAPGEEQQKCIVEAGEASKKVLEADKKEFGDKPWINQQIDNIGTFVNPLTNPLTQATLNAGPNAYNAVVSGLEEGLMLILGFFGDGFQFILEYLFILTALTLPLAIYMSFTPMGVQGLIGWVIIMVSLGFTKFYYNLAVAISANALINSNGVLHVVFGVVTGLLAPIIAFVLASGGGVVGVFAVLQFASMAANNGSRRAFAGR